MTTRNFGGKPMKNNFNTSQQSEPLALGVDQDNQRNLEEINETYEE